MVTMTAVRLFKLHIAHTEAEKPVFDQTILLCNVTNAVAKACHLKSTKVYINTKIIKHLYDRKPAEEFDFLIHNLHTMVKYPDEIYINKQSKRGDFIFVKELRNNRYICSIEVVDDCLINNVLEDASFVVTGFRLRSERYLKKYELMWSWKGGRPSS